MARPDHVVEFGDVVARRAQLQPSREDVEQYLEYLDKVRRLVADMKLKHGTDDWQPIDLKLDGGFNRVLAAHKLFDVLVVMPCSTE